MFDYRLSCMAPTARPKPRPGNEALGDLGTLLLFIGCCPLGGVSPLERQMRAFAKWLSAGTMILSNTVGVLAMLPPSVPLMLRHADGCVLLRHGLEVFRHKLFRSGRRRLFVRGGHEPLVRG